MENTAMPCVRKVDGRVIQWKTLPGLAFAMLMEG